MWRKKQAGSWGNKKAIATLKDALRWSRSQSKMKIRRLKWRCLEGSKTKTGKINRQHCEAQFRDVAVVPGAGLMNSRKESKRLQCPEVRNLLGVQYNKIRKTRGLFPSVPSPSKQIEAEAFQLGGNNRIFLAKIELS